MPITSVDFQGRTCTLTDANGLPVLADTQILDFKGLGWVIERGYAPRCERSTGYVIAKRLGACREFYPSVFGLSWVPEEPTEPGFDEWLYQSERRGREAGIL
jgi:hypothetical protein